MAFIDVQLDGGAGETGLSLVPEHARRGREARPVFVLATAYERACHRGVRARGGRLPPQALHAKSACVQCLRRIAQRRAGGPAREPPRIVARRKRSLVFLQPQEIWAFEAADRLTFVHTTHGTFDIDLSLAAVEASFGRAFVRVHRNWLVNAAHIKELERDGHETRLFVGPGVAEAGQGVTVPVARERAAALREMLLTNATGLRRL